MQTYIWDLLLKQPFEDVMYIAAMNGIVLTLDKSTGWLQAEYWVHDEKNTMEPNSNIKHLVANAILDKLKAEL